MKATTAALLLLTGASTAAAFVPSASFAPRTRVITRGYLDDLTNELNAPDNNPDLDRTREKTDAKETDRFGVQNWEGFVDFDEFDGGDGQMGVAGDGQKGLQKFGDDIQAQVVGNQMSASKTMSAKNAWGSSVGYADDLREQGIDTQRAQRLENWQNQQELRRKRLDHTNNLEAYETKMTDENWRELASFGVERTQDFDMEQEFGQVVAGDQVEGVIELKSRIGQPTNFEMAIKNEYMGFSDFRAAFTSATPADFSVEPTEGTLSKEPINFIVRFRPQNPGSVEGHLVIETEDFKKTWKVVGSTA